MATVRSPQLKIILCGEFGVGKTSLFRRFVNNTFTTDSSRKSTIGLDSYAKPFVANEDTAEIGNSVQLHLWDTGGLERVASITSSYYKYTEAALLVYSVDNLNSFHCLSQHLIEILSYAENAKIFLCGNKSDLKAEVTEDDVQDFCEQCGGTITNTYLTSCKTGAGVAEMFQDIANTLIIATKSKFELRALEERTSFQLNNYYAEGEANNDSSDNCAC